MSPIRRQETKNVETLQVLYTGQPEGSLHKEDERKPLMPTNKLTVVGINAQSKPGRGKYRQIFLNGFESVPLSSNPET